MTSRRVPLVVCYVHSGFKWSSPLIFCILLALFIIVMVLA